MKQPKKPTLAQKKLMSACRLDPDNWSVMLEDELYLHIINKATGTRKILDKQLQKCINTQRKKP